MKIDQLDWLYWNRDRVAESDWWLWTDDLTDQEIVEIGEFWLRNLDHHNHAGEHYWLIADITYQWRYQSQPMTVRQRRAVMAAVREHWGDLRVGAIA